jgi:hypothetical protein
MWRSRSRSVQNFKLQPTTRGPQGTRTGGYFASHDLEDFITVVGGRTSPLDEVEVASVELRRFVGDRRSVAHQTAHFQRLPGYLLLDEANQARFAPLMGRLSAYRRFVQLLDRERDVPRAMPCLARS